MLELRIHGQHEGARIRGCKSGDNVWIKAEHGNLEATLYLNLQQAKQIHNTLGRFLEIGEKKNDGNKRP